jgi:hypothetical protein
MPIQAIFCSPSLSIARIGASTVPMDAFAWVPSADPHAGETRIAPSWTLDLQPDGSVVPRLPTQVVLRDVGDLRPVAPFVEIWCDVGGDGQPNTWSRVPLTTSVLQAEGLNVANLTFAVEAMNSKAARRTRNPNLRASLRFGTFPPVQVMGNQHAARRLLGISPPTAARPMIPQGRSIDLGKFQVIQPTTQPAPNTTPWDSEVNVSVVRFRFTPPRGEFYGPTAVAGTGVTVRGTFHPRVPASNAFLDNDAGWLRAPGMEAFTAPADTFDGAETDNGLSLGIVDDTSEVHITVTLDQSPIGRQRIEARANIFSGPPDFAPDRRPFLSLADDLNDRISPALVAQRNGAMTAAERDRWVEDLFERAFETVSLLNVDFWRSRRSSDLTPAEQRPQAIQNDRYPAPLRAMGSRDSLRDGNISIEAPSSNVPLPLSDRARDRHRGLSDIIALKNFVREHPDRLAALIRKPFSFGATESALRTTMQMPPFMRASNAGPLTLTKWQYELLMAWRDSVVAAPELPIAFETRLEEEASVRSRRRRSAVLARLDNARSPRNGESNAD